MYLVGAAITHVCVCVCEHCSLSEEVQGSDLLHLAALPRLHKACLWFSLKEKFAEPAQKLRELSDNRINVSFNASMSSF